MRVELLKIEFASDEEYHRSHGVDVGVTDTTSGGLVTFSKDPLAPLEKMVVECLLANLQKFNEANEELRREAIARHLGKRSNSMEEST